MVKHSVYLMGTTAHFSFTAENVDVGTVGADEFARKAYPVAHLGGG